MAWSGEGRACGRAGAGVLLDDGAGARADAVVLIHRTPSGKSIL